VSFRPLVLASVLGAVMFAPPALAAEPGIAVQSLAAPVESMPAATDVRVGGDAKQTRFVVDLTRKVDVTSFTLADPYRVVIDLPQIAFKLPPRTGGMTLWHWHARSLPHSLDTLTFDIEGLAIYGFDGR
jgi:N-acetylmuramoyl-L-alanine amidase